VTGLRWALSLNHLLLAHQSLTPVVEFGGEGVGAAGEPLGHLQLAAVFEVGDDAGRPEGMG